MDINPEYFALIGGTLTTLSFIPQAIKVIKTRSTEAISLLMYILFTIGVFCWGVFGYMVGSPSCIIANVVTFILAVIILTMKVRDVLRK